MRLADVQLAIPAILVALMIDGIARILVPAHMRDVMAIYVLILAIGVSDWPRYARVTRGSALVERSKEYVSAARVIGIHPILIMLRHVLPNVLGPVLVVSPWPSSPRRPFRFSASGCRRRRRPSAR
jgi:peptide/nickel transport system permease protein